MVDIDIALARLHLATDQSEAMQYGLRHRQDDLLALEQDVRLVASGRTTGRVVIDEAEDIRRSVAIYTTDHLPEIKVALDRASLTLAVVTSDGDVPPDVAARLEQHIGNATRETMRANDHLEEVVDALRRTSQALPGEEDLARTAQVSVDAAAAQLDSARRATFRIVEDLPIIERELKEISAERDQLAEPPPPRMVTPAPRSLGQAAERHRPPDPGGRRAAGAAPGR
jgi:hypothetical protein